MPSIQTPAYPPVEHASPFLPPVSERTPEVVWKAVSHWPYWGEIQQVAQKEYGISPESFVQLLPEYQRFLTIILLGYQSVGMFSGEVDKLWHSHVLSTHLYLSFSLTLHGRYINHVPQVPCPHDEQKGGSICQKCQSCVNCSIRCGECKSVVHGSPNLRATTAEQFAEAYRTVFKVPPSAIWNLAVAEGCATD